MIRPENRKPDFNNLAAVLEGKKPARNTLFEIFVDAGLENYLNGNKFCPVNHNERMMARVHAFDSAGYDFVSIIAQGFRFPRKQHKPEGAMTQSLNSGAMITDRDSFDKYPWEDPDAADYGLLQKAGEILPNGMKLIPYSSDGVLENVIGITGYDNLCYMLYEDRQLVADIFFEVGTKIKRYFENCLKSPYVGAVVLNDDWGFNTQTMLAPADMREFVFPYHREITKLAHSKGVYSILHSCGRYDAVINDIIDDIGFDGRHSYEDNIIPVEEAYQNLKGRIAVLGGMDVDFLARSSPEEISARCKKMLRSSADGGYALGSGNSIPDYVPTENYVAMIKTVFE